MPTYEAHIPEEIARAYGLEHITEAQRLSGGLVNQTILVTSDSGRRILQRVSGEIHPQSYEDTKVVADHLVTNGLRAPVPLPTISGEFSATDRSGFQWRSSVYIESDGVPDDIDGDLVSASGALIGEWHKAASTLAYVPKFGIPGFHNTALYARRLRACMDALHEDDIRTARLLLTVASKSIQLNDPHQIIHADTKPDNMTYEDRAPTALIDLDTVMRGSVLTDIGDFLRSVIGRTIKKESEQGTYRGPHLEYIGKFIDGYLERNDLAMPYTKALRHVKHATSLLAAELGIRYLCDMTLRADERYFACDDHSKRAKLQLTVATLVTEATINDMIGGK